MVAILPPLKPSKRRLSPIWLWLTGATLMLLLHTLLAPARQQHSVLARPLATRLHSQAPWMLHREHQGSSSSSSLQPHSLSAAAAQPVALPTQEVLQPQDERQQQMLQTQAKVVQCLMAPHEEAGLPAAPATYAAHRELGEVAKLIPVRLWQSAKPLPQQILTVVTALSKERLPMLEAQCRSWPGPLAAVVYEPTLALQQREPSSSTAKSQAGPAANTHANVGRKLLSSMKRHRSAPSQQRALLQGRRQQQAAASQQKADAEKAVQDTFGRMEALRDKGCSLSVLLVTEFVDASLEEHLPINSMRNQAVLLAQTPLVAMLDADMVVSHSLAASLEDPVDAEAFTALVRGSQGDGPSKRLVVLPAFETLPHKSNGNTAEDELTHRVAEFAQQADKQALQGLISAGLLGPFNKVVNQPGQAETDFKRWLAFEPNTSSGAITYAIQPKHDKFEPWYIMDRQAALRFPYDEVFRGYGKNKIAHRLWMSSLGFQFEVHGSAFIVHRVHAESDAKHAWRAQMHKGGPLNSARLAQMLPSMQQRSYHPKLSNATATCAKQAMQRHQIWQQQQQQKQQQQHVQQPKQLTLPSQQAQQPPPPPPLPAPQQPQPQPQQQPLQQQQQHQHQAQTIVELTTQAAEA